MNGHRIPPASGDETIELQLTPEQLLELSRAAELAEPLAPAQVSAPVHPLENEAWMHSMMTPIVD